MLQLITLFSILSCSQKTGNNDSQNDSVDTAEDVGLVPLDLELNQQDWDGFIYIDDSYAARQGEWRWEHFSWWGFGLALGEPVDSRIAFDVALADEEGCLLITDSVDLDNAVEVAPQLYLDLEKGGSAEFQSEDYGERTEYWWEPSPRQISDGFSLAGNPLTFRGASSSIQIPKELPPDRIDELSFEEAVSSGVLNLEWTPGEKDASVVEVEIEGASSSELNCRLEDDGYASLDASILVEDCNPACSISVYRVSVKAVEHPKYGLWQVAARRGYVMDRVVASNHK